MALSLSSAGQFGALNAYWGQHGGYRLRDVCDSGVQYATVSFVNNSPEHSNGYLGTNFGANCGGYYYVNPSNGKETKLLMGCTQIQEDIPYCKAKGVKILLSIGGFYFANSQYDVSTNAKGVEFAEQLYNSFGPYKSSFKGPRPFDVVNGAHTSVDGFDFDLEQTKPNNKPYIAMIDWLRQKDSSMLITAAPQCVETKGPNTNYNDDLIMSAQFDALFVQFYNNKVCDAIPNNTPFDEFNYDYWVKQVKASKKSKNAKIFIGLPASLAGVDGKTDAGYILPKAMKDLVCKFKSHSNFGGVSLWDATFALQNKLKLDPSSKTDVAKTYIQHALDALKYGCDKVPDTTTSSAKPTSTSTTSTTSKVTSTTSSSSVKTTSSTTSSVKVTSTTTSKQPESTTTSKQVESTTTSKQVDSTTTSKQVDSTTTSKQVDSTTTSKQVDSTTTSKQAESTTTSEQPETTTTSEKPETTTTSEKPETTTTSEQPQITSTTSEEIASTTTSSQEQITTSSVAITSGVWSNSTTSSAEMTTKTVYTTSVYTVSQCPPAVTDCPYKTGHVVTETIPLYTTVCPVTETALPPKPTTTKAPPALITSTVYTTKTHTITSCPPQVTDCPVGHVTTEVVPLYTTVCPVEETQTVPVATTLTVVPVVTMETSTRPAGETTEVCVGAGCPGGPGASSAPGAVCPGPDCPPASSAPGAVCPGPDCPAATTAPGSGCTGADCPGVAIPTNSWSQTVTPVNPTAPVTAGASSLALGLTGLIAMVAAQLIL